jgi:hypothetical protein
MTRGAGVIFMLLILAPFSLALPGSSGAPPAAGRVPVLAWLGPPAEETTPERYRELAGAGFTRNFSTFPDAAAMQKALDVAHAAGIQQFVSIPELATDPEGTARRFKGHPALAGYHLRDEPNAADFPALAQWVKRIQSVDPEHGCYINLFPNYASPAQLGTPTYAAHVERFLAEVPVPYLSFDHYPVTAGGLRPGWYENLEIIARAAKNAKKPFWAFALAVAHDPYPIAQLEHLRLQVFSDLAYGAECIQYFTYWTPKSTIWNFHEGPLESDGRRTAIYDRVKQVNGEIQGLAGVFVGSKVMSVGHTGTPPKGTEAYHPVAPITGVRTGGEGAVVSLLSKGKRRFLAVVNRDYKAAMSLSVTFDGSTSVREIRKDRSTRAAGQDGYSGRVAPGDIAVLAWNEK